MSMELLKNLVDYGVVTLLFFMSFIAVMLFIERLFFYRKLDVNKFKNKKQLDVALTKNLTFIGTIASNSPYIGLLGTVLAIMLTFMTMSEGDIFIIAYGDPKLRQKALDKIEKKSWELATLVHPTAYISKYATISAGSIICPFAIVGFKAHIKKNVLMNTYSAAGHHSEIGDSCVLCPKSLIAGKSICGSQSFIGSGAVVTPGKNIGKLSSIGALSVVYRNVKDGGFIIGNPAK